MLAATTAVPVGAQGVLSVCKKMTLLAEILTENVTKPRLEQKICHDTGCQ